MLNGLIDLSEQSRQQLTANGQLNEEVTSALTIPTSKDEEWRFISLRSLAKNSFSPVDSVEDVDLSEYVTDGGIRFVFVNGKLNTSLSTSVYPEGLSVDYTIDKASLIDFNDDVFSTLNQNLYTDALTISVAKNLKIEDDIHILNIVTKENVYAAPRIRFVAGAFAEYSVIEHYHSQVAGAVYFANPFVEFQLDTNAKVKHYRVQRDSKQAFHIGRFSATVEKHANFESFAFNFGAKLCRNDVRLAQLSPETDFTIDGLVMIADDQVSDTHTVMDHRFSYGNSHQLHKCLVGGKAHSVFNGKIFVRQDAQKIDSFQENRNILLTDSAQVNTKPQLEIFADDVRCSHGATIGQMDEEELFYLTSRGLNKTEATLLITRGFALEVIENVENKALQELLEKEVVAFSSNFKELQEA